MKKTITDAVQIIVALSITVGVATAMAAPNPPKLVHKAALVVKTVQHAAVVVAPVVAAPVAAQPVYTGNDLLMHEAGIPDADFGAADYIISHESGWNPDATEPTSGAHGLPQALPYSKTGCAWTDEMCQLSWANTYANARYGGWWYAYDYWVANHNW